LEINIISITFKPLRSILSKQQLDLKVQYFTQFGHIAELNESELDMEKHANSKAK
jgi:hypothetical protein